MTTVLPSRRPGLRRGLMLLGIVTLAVLLRAWTLWQLPVDFDEPTYVRAAYDYASAMRAGDWNAVIDYPQNSEHPPLVKLVYGAGVLALGENASWTNVLFLSRAISAVFGSFAVLLLALVDPLAGTLLAVHTLTVKYTGQAYLEALPLAAALAALLAMRRAPRTDSGRRTGRSGAWLWLSAVCLGIAAAGKLNYPPLILLPLLYLALIQRRTTWPKLVLYAAVALVTFWLFDPALWHDPLGRLVAQARYHATYAQGAEVQMWAYPWYQPLLWLSSNWPVRWHPMIFFYSGIDAVIFWSAVAGATAAGFRREWRERAWLLVWMAAGILLLLLWPTKWPQYTLALVPAFCLGAAEFLRRARAWIAEQEDYWPWIKEIFPHPSKLTWIVPGVMILGLGVFLGFNRFQIETGQRGWSHVGAGSGLLPSNTVYALAATSDGRVIAGTDRGAAVWMAGSAESGVWTVYNKSNSGLADDTVLAVVAAGPDLWFGTAAGVSRYAGGQWQTFRAEDLGLSGERVAALAFDGQGQVWAGTDAGAARFDGGRWQAITSATSGLPSDHVTALAVQGDVVWFGTGAGLSCFDTISGTWSPVTLSGIDLGRGITSLSAEPQAGGRLWAGTGSNGLVAFDGDQWRPLSIANSSIPLNSVSALYQSVPDLLWVGTAFSIDRPGGLLSRFDGQNWHTYIPERTGYSGGEVTAMVQDSGGRLWVGTRTLGIDIYEMPDR